MAQSLTQQNISTVSGNWLSPWTDLQKRVMDLERLSDLRTNSHGDVDNVVTFVKKQCLKF